MTAAASDYTAASLTVLSGLDAIRKRPGMYIGSTDSRGVNHLATEIIDNSIDEALAGHGDRVDVTLHADGSVEVLDAGRGIPVDLNTKVGMSGLALALTQVHGGGKFGGEKSGYATSGGLHGVGSAAVNALSRRMDATVWRAGKKYQLSFARGVPGTFDGPGPKATFTPGGDVAETGRAKRGQQGTSIRYWYNAEFFEPGASLDVDDLVAKLRNTAFLVRGLTMVLHDARNGAIETTEFHYPDWLAGMVDFYAPAGEKGVSDTLVFTGTGTYKENAADENGVMRSGVERVCEIEVSLRWGTGYDYRVNGFTNVIGNRDGGAHVTGFENAMSKTLLDLIDGTRGLLRPKEQPPTAPDVLEGVTAVVHVKVPEPQFTSQTKDRLSTRGVTRAVEQVVTTGLRAWAADRRTKAQARVVMEKIVNAARVRLEETAQKDRARKKTSLESGIGLPAKLSDCQNVGDPRSELFLVEGDSAAGSGKKGRSAKFQAILPLRGKILNVQKATFDKMIANAECEAIITVLGAGSGRSFDIEQMRYGRVLLMADADVDGSHIRTLLLTLFYRYMRPVIDAGRLYAAVPPLFKVVTRGRNPEELYAYTQSDLDQILTRLRAEGRDWVTPIERNKGLGEMNAEELWATTMNPATRTVRRITAADGQAAEDALELLMGDRVEPRRAWLVDYADEVDREALDA